MEKKRIHITLTHEKYDEIIKELERLTVIGKRPSFNSLVLSLLNQWLKEAKSSN